MRELPLRFCELGCAFASLVGLLPALLGFCVLGWAFACFFLDIMRKVIPAKFSQFVTLFLRWEEAERQQDTHFKSRSRGSSKKLNCPALFAIKKVLYFPGYSLSPTATYYERRVSGCFKKSCLSMGTDHFHLNKSLVGMGKDGKFCRVQVLRGSPLGENHL